MNNNWVNKALWGLGLLLAMSISACLEPEEGCLDESASNYNVTADRNCCCEYPQLILRFTHRWDTLDFSPGGFYPHNGKVLSFSRLQYYVSEIALRSGAELFPIEEVFSSDSLQASVIDDVILVQSNQSQHTVGTFVQPDKEMDSLVFRLGLGEEWDGAEPDLFEEGHPLHPASDSVYDASSGQYFTMTMQLRPDSSSTDEKALYLRFEDNVFLQKAVTLIPVRGFDPEIRIEVDYKIWMEDIDFENDGEDQIRQKLEENAEAAFSVVP